MRVTTQRVHVALGARDKEAARLMQAIESLEVDVAPIHDVKGVGFGGQLIQNVHIEKLAVADMDETRDVAAPDPAACAI